MIQSRYLSSRHCARIIHKSLFVKVNKRRRFRSRVCVDTYNNLAYIQQTYSQIRQFLLSLMRLLLQCCRPISFFTIPLQKYDCAVKIRHDGFPFVRRETRARKDYTSSLRSLSKLFRARPSTPLHIQKSNNNLLSLLSSLPVYLSSLFYIYLTCFKLSTLYLKLDKGTCAFEMGNA